MDPSIDELSGFCFGCGPRNPHGLHLQFAINSVAHTATAPVTLDENFQGAPGFIHGGILATLLDEAMSKLNRPLGVLAMTRRMEVDYLRPAPIRTPLTLLARHIRRDGRKLFHEAELLDAAGATLARCTGLWIVIDPALIHARPGDAIEPA